MARTEFQNRCVAANIEFFDPVVVLLPNPTKVKYEADIQNEIDSFTTVQLKDGTVVKPFFLAETSFKEVKYFGVGSSKKAAIRALYQRILATGNVPEIKRPDPYQAHIDANPKSHRKVELVFWPDTCMLELELREDRGGRDFFCSLLNADRMSQLKSLIRHVMRSDDHPLYTSKSGSTRPAPPKFAMTKEVEHEWSGGLTADTHVSDVCLCAVCSLTRRNQRLAQEKHEVFGCIGNKGTSCAVCDIVKHPFDAV